MLFCHIIWTIIDHKTLKDDYDWPHELVLSIRGDEADATLRVKLTEAHTLVESAVIDGDGLLPTAGRKKHIRDTQTHKRQKNISSLVEHY